MVRGKFAHRERVGGLRLERSPERCRCSFFVTQLTHDSGSARGRPTPVQVEHVSVKVVLRDRVGSSLPRVLQQVVPLGRRSQGNPLLALASAAPQGKPHCSTMAYGFR